MTGSASSERAEPGPIVGLASREVYRNPWIAVREDNVRFPNGHEGIYGVVTCAPAVGVLPFIDDDRVLLVRQFRYVTQRLTWEMPTGAVNPGESPMAAANRELAEETGYIARHLEPVSSFTTSKSVVDEEAHLFLGYRLLQATAHSDETEEILTGVFPFDEVLAMVERSEIVDGMTVIAVLLAAVRRSRGPAPVEQV